MSLTHEEMLIKKKLQKAMKIAKQADTLAEEACMLTMDVYNSLNFEKREITPRGEEVKKRSSDAHSHGGDARAALADMVYKIEKAIEKI